MYGAAWSVVNSFTELLMAKKVHKQPEKPEFVYRASITLPNGKVIFARQYGKKAFKIPVPANDN